MYVHATTNLLLWSTHSSFTAHGSTSLIFQQQISIINICMFILAHYLSGIVVSQGMTHKYINTIYKPLNPICYQGCHMNLSFTACSFHNSNCNGTLKSQSSCLWIFCVLQIQLYDIHLV